MSMAAQTIVETYPYFGRAGSYEESRTDLASIQVLEQSNPAYLTGDPHFSVVTNSATASPIVEGRGTAGVYEISRKSLPLANKLIAEWQGRVVSIHDDYFVADVKGVIGEGVEGCSEEAVIPMADVQEQDKPQFRVGAFFRLCINYQLLPNKRKVRTTTVSFRRLPAYSCTELIEADERARDLIQQLHVE